MVFTIEMYFKKSVIYVLELSLLILLGSCTHGRAQLAKLQQTDSLLAENPHAAYDSLCVYEKQQLYKGSEKVEMKQRLLMAKAQNKLFKPLPSDSLFLEVVNYYDDKGTANEKMEAHYLLGCIYRDRKEAPMAIECYQEAVECADTLSEDCDYTTLFSIYGQMADVYRYQYLQKEALGCYQKYSYYASRANNMACSIQGIDGMASAYYALGDTLKAIELTQRCNMLYKKQGMYKDAVQVLPTLIYAYLQSEQYQQARHYMDIYEKESGLFDKDNSILPGREHYYMAKGKYYLGVNQIDSAEYYYRKLGRYGFRYETTQGLLAIYSLRLNRDSIKKYSIRCEQEMDKILNGTQAKAVVLANSLYDYTRLQKTIVEEKQLKLRDKYVAIIVVLVILLGVYYLVKRYRKIQKQMSDELKKVNRDYVVTFQNMEKARQEVAMLQENIELSVKKKLEEMMSLQATLREYKEKCEQFDKADNKKALMASDIFQKFKEMSKLQKRKTPSKDDWTELYAEFQQRLPVLYEQMQKARLSPQERQVCMLTYLNIDNAEISVLVDTSSKTISNARKKANKKLFGADGASSLNQNLLKF